MAPVMTQPNNQPSGQPDRLTRLQPSLGNRLAQKVCLVTGTGSGIGQAIAQRFAEEGAKVLCVDINGETAAATAEAIQVAGGTAESFAADISQTEQIRAYRDRCLSLYGRIDVLVNNAGVNLPGLLHEMSEADIDRTLNVNLRGSLYSSREIIPQMLKQGGGSIVNISSVNGLVTEPLLTAYAASKGGIVMLTKGIALDYAKQNIRCNCICPGWVDTPINYAHAEMLGGIEKVYAEMDQVQPIGRPGEPREIAHLALFLASDEASFMTGSIVTADGGFTAQ